MQLPKTRKEVWISGGSCVGNSEQTLLETHMKNCQFIIEDCVAGMKRLASRKIPVNLILSDPPYNFGQKYADYKDKISDVNYAKFTYDWLEAAHSALAEDGSLFIFCPDEWVSLTETYCRSAFRMTRRSWIIWTYTFGQASQTSFTRAHTHILYFSKSEDKFVFNDHAIRVPSARQAVYGDKRAKSGGKLPDDTWALLKPDVESLLPTDGDVMLQSRVCGTYKEREKHSPNQLPIPLCERIVRVASLPGQTVLDPFLGTGASAEAAIRLGRRFIGFDVSKECVEASYRRIARITE